MARRNSEAYKEAFEKAMKVKARYGRMPYWNEFEKYLGDDLSSVVKGLGVSSSKEMSIELLHEIRRREGRPATVLEDYVYPGVSPMNSPEKKYLGAVKSQETYDSFWQAMRAGVGIPEEEKYKEESH